MTNFDPDNPDQEMIHQCIKYARRHLNPIIDWTTDEVWEFLHKYNVPYCCLYDQGFKRLGCIGCPMGTSKNREEWFRRWPTYKQAYIHAFDRMIEVRNEGGVSAGLANRSGRVRAIHQPKYMNLNANQWMEWFLKG